MDQGVERMIYVLEVSAEVKRPSWKMDQGVERIKYELEVRDEVKRPF